MTLFRRIRHSSKLPVIAYLILALSIAGAFAVQTHNAQKELHDGLVGSCQRVNILRAQSNLSDSVSFKVLSSTVQRENTLSTTSEGKNKAAHDKNIKLVVAQGNRINVTRLTDCDRAVNHPDEYRPPVAGPLGNIQTGKLSPEVRKILKDSRAYLRKFS